MVINSITPVHLTCYSAGNGSISVNITGGTPNYSYQWTNSVASFNSTSQNISGLAAETYSLTVTDQNSCSITTSVIISQPPVLSMNLTKTDETCYQFCDGSIQANVSGGQIPYTYLWSNTLSSSSLNNLCPGTYIVTATDNNGCTISQSATVTGNPLLQINVVSVVPATCGSANGEATISFQGGLTGYSIQWSTGGNSVHETGMPAGNHMVTLIDDNGCIATQQIAIQNLAGPTITTIIPAPVSCAGANDGVAIVSYTPSSPPAPPYISTWNNTQVGDTASSLAGGIYYVSVTDANNCMSVGSIVVDEPTPFVSVISTSSVIHNHCFGDCSGSASVLAGGGTQPYTYNWLGTGQVASSAFNLCAGPYSVVAEDAHGCTSVNQVTINEPTPIVVNGVVTDIHCNGDNNGIISVTASGGTPVYQFTWQSPLTGTNSVVANLPAGIYSVVVTDIWNCSSTSTYTVNEPSPIFVYTSSTPATCGLDNGTATVDTVNGGTLPYQYNWSPGNMTSPTINNLADGTYQLHVIDFNGCGGFSNVTVAQFNPPTNVLFNIVNTTCPGGFTGSLTANPVGGVSPYTYVWSNNQTQQTAINLSSGTYSVTVSDRYSCTVTNTAFVGQPNPIIVLTNGDTTICQGLSTVNITANATGGTAPYTFLWTDTTFANPNSPNQLVSPDVQTNYYVLAYDAVGCASPIPGVVSINVYQPITLNISPNAVVCEGDSYNIIVNAQGGMPPYQYIWNHGTGNPNPVIPFDTTTYVVHVSDACGTPPTADSVTISVMQAPHLIRDPRPQTGCVSLLANFDCVASVPVGAINYLWTFGDPSSGTSNESSSSTPSHLYTIPGTYDIALTLTSDSGGCISSFTFPDLAIANAVPTADFSYTPTIGITVPFHGVVQFNALTDSLYDITWYFEGGGNSASVIMNPIYEYTAPGIYDVLLVVSDNGCVDTVLKTVLVGEDFTLWIPTAFYPGTGAADGYFYPKGNSFDKKNYYLAIYDRWGQTIFETTEYPEGTNMRPDDIRTKANADNGWTPGGWNGGKNNDINKLVPVGTYTWFLKVKEDNESGIMHEKTGPVTVIR